MPQIVELTEISAIIAAAGVLIGVIYYILDMRNQGKMRHTDLVMRLYATFSSTEFQDAWAHVMAIPEDEKNPDDLSFFENRLGFREVNQVCLFFEGIGILLQRRLLDTKMVEDLFGGAVGRAWEKVGTRIVKGRRHFGDPTIYYYFEYLYNEMKQREKPT